MWEKHCWTASVYEEFVQYLFTIQEIDYRNFHQKLVPGVNNLIGIRIPRLWKLASEIAKGNAMEFLACVCHDYYEEAMVHGMVLAKMQVKKKEDLELLLEQIRVFIPFIDNWAVCDIFCGGLKIVKKYKKEFWDFIQTLVFTQEEYWVRTGLVLLKNNYLEEEYLKEVFYICDKAPGDKYYINMAVAWLISAAYIKHQEQTEAYLYHNNLNEFTYRKALQKIVESNCVPKEKKEWAREMKKRKQENKKIYKIVIL